MLSDEMEKQGNFLFRHRGTLPVAVLLLGFAVYVYTLRRGGGLPGFVPAFAYDMLCLAVCLLGLAVRVHTVGHTPQNTSGRNTASQLADEVNTTGMYSVLRHPLYLGNFFMWLGAAMLTQNLCFVAVFVLFYWLYYERIMLAEEGFLLRKFGARYSGWAEATPAFVPKLSKWEAPRLPFSWKKVLRKEKNGLFAVFLVFFLFKAVGSLVLQGRLSVDWWLWLATLLSGLLYLLLKFAARQTKLLDEAGR